MPVGSRTRLLVERVTRSSNLCGREYTVRSEDLAIRPVCEPFEGF
jgi:hypothetical protein